MAATDDSMIPASGAVFTFGKSRFAENVPNRFWVKNDRVLQTACGDEHTALVAESGRVFTFGANDWGQLGIGSTKPATKPTCVKEFKHEKASLVACGRVHTLVATESGKLFSFGANGEGQLGVEDVPSSDKPLEISSIKPQKYKMLAAGADHSVALTEDGDLYVWGGGSEGQLGLGDQTGCPNPTELKTEEAVICVACGYYHTAFVTDTGDLYTFGETDGGKLGLGDDHDTTTDTPQKVSLPEKAKWVSCGGSHTVVLTESGKVYTFGDGSNGQLGHNTKVLHSESPHELKFKYKVTHISCGENHTAIITERGQLFTFGDGRHGKLGLGLDCFSNQLFPSKVERFNKFLVEDVSCGGCHMIVRAHMKLQNGEVESSEDEEEELEEAKTTLNNSLKLDGSIDPGGTFSARDRRRQTVTRSPSLNRTLPPLANGKPASQLSHTVPAIKTQSPLAREIIPRKTEIESDVNKNEDDTENNKNQNHANHVQQLDQIEAVNDAQLKSSPRPMPRPLPRKKLEDEKTDDEKKKQEESEKEESEEEKKTIKETEKSKEDEKKKDEESEEEEEIKSEDETQKHTDQVRSLPSVPVPSPRAKVKMSDEEDEEGEEHVEEEKEEDEGDKKEKEMSKKEEKKKDKKDKKKDKKKKTNIFGRKSTGLSEDEEDEDEEEEDEDDMNDEEEIKEEEVKEKEKKKEKEDKKKKDKDKKKDKKDKKDKKKKGKDKDDEEEEEEEDEDNDEDEGKSKKDKKKDKKDKDKKDKDKKDKKDKKKDKDKKGKKDKEKDEEDDEEEEDDDEKDSKKKDKKKDKDKKNKDDDKDEEDEEKEKSKEDGDKKPEGEKKEEKKEEPKPPPKKSRTCTIL